MKNLGVPTIFITAISPIVMCSTRYKYIIYDILTNAHDFRKPTKLFTPCFTYCPNHLYRISGTLLVLNIKYLINVSRALTFVFLKTTFVSQKFTRVITVFFFFVAMIRKRYVSTTKTCILLFSNLFFHH